jgi:two-component system, cell cycle sensor histidine kinase and response regulator CckA
MRILIVEDEGLVANNMSDSLRKNGYEISGIAMSGEDALEKVSALQPDLLLMDIHLSGKMDGIEAAERVRAQFSIPVIFLTAHANPEVLDRAKRTYPFGYLVKPIRHVDLVSAIEVALYKHQMEQKLRQREAWLATALRCAADGVIVTDATGRVEYMNDLSKNILGIAGDDVIGKNFKDVVRLKTRFGGIPAGDLVQLAILQGATMNIGTDLILIDDASDKEADIEGEVALCEIGGSIVGTVFTFRDVTVSNHEEEHRRLHLGTLACARMAGAISTELRHFLAVGETGLISRMIDQLDMVRLRGASFPCTLDLNALVSDICRELRPGIPPNIRLTSQLQPVLHRISADPAKMKQAIVSLILHSQDAMPNGGTIHIITRNCAFERHGLTGPDENYVRLIINHTSPGIEGDEAHRLFEPFSGADPSADKLDLRLFFVHGIISDTGGSIRARAEPSQCMNFEILLRQSVDEKPAICPAPALAEPNQEKAAILLLQPDHDIRCLTSESLESVGYEALGASDLSDALEWCTDYPGSIALAIIDLDLSHMDGLAAAGEISARHPGIKIIFTSDHAVDSSVETYWIHCGARFQSKPFRLEELFRIVNEMLTVDYRAVLA